MTPDHSLDAIESLDGFCASVSQAISSDGFVVRIRPGDHLVDDAGADSLTVLSYAACLQARGIELTLDEFDTSLLFIDKAYQAWLQTMATHHRGAFTHEC